MDTTRRGHSRWNYKFVQVNGKTMYQHRHVMEQHLGRKLLRSEHIHHINGNTLDNRIDNLLVVTAQEHTRMHAEEYSSQGKNWGVGRRIVEGEGYWTPAREAHFERVRARNYARNNSQPTARCA